MTPPTTLAVPEAPRHSATVRITHWLTVICFFALLLSGLEIIVSHPRFYWGETGNVLTHPAFIIPIPASRATVPTAYHYLMPDQNGWSRYLHFQAAWLLVLTGLLYVLVSLRTGHIRRDLLPPLRWSAFRAVFAKYRQRTQRDPAEAHTYNAVQRLTYLSVVFVIFPLIVWTGLAMSPAFTGAVPIAASALGGRQTARTLHFFLSGSLVLFLIVHVTMVVMAGFGRRMRAMITGGKP